MESSIEYWISLVNPPFSFFFLILRELFIAIRKYNRSLILSRILFVMGVPYYESWGVSVAVCVTNRFCVFVLERAPENTISRALGKRATQGLHAREHVRIPRRARLMRARAYQGTRDLQGVHAHLVARAALGAHARALRAWC